MIDVCGTGGDGAHTLNISTAVAFVAAGAGLKVAKHGNRAMSSPLRLLRRAGRARRQHRRRPPTSSAARWTRPASASCSRRPTTAPCATCCRSARSWASAPIFNLLGPLSNPAGAQRQVLGVLRRALGRAAGARAGRARAPSAPGSVHGDGLDEMTTTGDDPGRRMARRRRAPLQRHARRPSGCRARRWPTCAAASRPTTRGAARRCWRRDRALPRHRAAERRRRPAGRRQGRDPARGRRAGRRGRSTTAGHRRRWTGWSR